MEPRLIEKRAREVLDRVPGAVVFERLDEGGRLVGFISTTGASRQMVAQMYPDVRLGNAFRATAPRG